MPKKVDITIENKLTTEERDIKVIHHTTRSAHIISHNSSITLPLRSAGEEYENDYLHISVVSGPGNLWMDCVINIPSWADFEISSQGKLTAVHLGDAKRTLLKIPPGPPNWELKITRPTGLSSIDSVSGDNIIIGDE